MIMRQRTILPLLPCLVRRKALLNVLNPSNFVFSTLFGGKNVLNCKNLGNGTFLHPFERTILIKNKI